MGQARMHLSTTVCTHMNSNKFILNSPITTQILRLRLSPLIQRHLLQPHDEEKSPPKQVQSLRDGSLSAQKTPPAGSGLPVGTSHRCSPCRSYRRRLNLWLLCRVRVHRYIPAPRSGVLRQQQTPRNVVGSVFDDRRPAPVQFFLDFPPLPSPCQISGTWTKEKAGVLQSFIVFWFRS